MSCRICNSEWGKRVDWRVLLNVFFFFIWFNSFGFLIFQYIRLLFKIKHVFFYKIKITIQIISHLHYWFFYILKYIYTRYTWIYFLSLSTRDTHGGCILAEKLLKKKNCSKVFRIYARINRYLFIQFNRVYWIKYITSQHLIFFFFLALSQHLN